MARWFLKTYVKNVAAFATGLERESVEELHVPRASTLVGAQLAKDGYGRAAIAFVYRFSEDVEVDEHGGFPTRRDTFRLTKDGESEGENYLGSCLFDAPGAEPVHVYLEDGEEPASEDEDEG